MDCFTRVIVGYAVSDSLRMEDTTLAAIKKAVKTVGKRLRPGLVFNTDGGGQYDPRELVRFTGRYKIINSMSQMAYENGKAERLNGGD